MSKDVGLFPHTMKKGLSNGRLRMRVLMMRVSEHSAANITEPAERNPLRIVTGISILFGPFVYLVCRAIGGAFVQGSQALALAVLCVAAFELAWLAYGAIVLIRKGMSMAAE